MAGTRRRRAAPRPLLIVARSARALACAARAAGHAPRVIDMFGDTDTRAAATHLRVVPHTADFRFESAPLLAAVDALAGARALPLIWGGGLEAEIDLLQALAVRHEMLGTPPSALPAITGAAERRASLVALGLATPEVAFGRVPAQGNWLRKCAAQAGGFHVTAAVPGARLANGDYAQRYVHGRSMSAAFLAAPTRVELLGVCTHLFWPGVARPWIWAGATAGEPASPRLLRALTGALPRLVAAFGLRGLCGVDFVLAGEDDWSIVDINPRPTATLDLLVTPASALRAHLAACRGAAWSVVQRRRHPRAQAIVYLDDPIRVAKSLDWPAWVADRPGAGVRLPRGAPLCTVAAEGVTADAARARLAARIRRLRRLFGRDDGPLPTDRQPPPR